MGTRSLLFGLRPGSICKVKSQYHSVLMMSLLWQQTLEDQEIWAHFCCSEDRGFPLSEVDPLGPKYSFLVC